MDAFDFNDAVANFGGALDVSKLREGPAKAFSREVARAQRYISTAHAQLPSLPPIYFGLIDNSKFNAVAWKHKGEHFIGVYAGVIALCQILFFRALADPNILVDVGNPAEEIDGLPLIANLVPDAGHLIAEGHRVIVPRNMSRDLYAQHLTQCAFDFIVGHELTHIVNGHVDYLDHIHGSSFLVELVSGVGGNEKLDRQTLEMDADAGATCHAVASILGKCSGKHLVHPPMDQFYKDPAKAIANWIFSVYSLFRLWGDAPFLGVSLDSSPYPPVRIRQFMLGSTAASYLLSINQKQVVDAWMKISPRNLIECEKLFSILQGIPIQISGLIDAVSDESQKHTVILVDHWTKYLREELLPFAYGKLPD